MTKQELEESGPVLKNSIITAKWREGFTVRAADGRAARLAVIDDMGHVLDEGDLLAAELFDMARITERDYLFGRGILKIYSTPEGLVRDSE